MDRDTGIEAENHYDGGFLLRALYRGERIRNNETGTTFVIRGHFWASNANYVLMYQMDREKDGKRFKFSRRKIEQAINQNKITIL